MPQLNRKEKTKQNKKTTLILEKNLNHHQKKKENYYFSCFIEREREKRKISEWNVFLYYITISTNSYILEKKFFLVRVFFSLIFSFKNIYMK